MPTTRPLITIILTLAVATACLATIFVWRSFSWQVTEVLMDTLVSDIVGLLPVNEDKTTPVDANPPSQDPMPRPHIIMMVFDDLGRSDHTIFESSSTVGYSTPTLERLAKREGAILTNYYTQTVCSPTRAALLTGRFPHTTGMQHMTTLVPGSTVGLPYEVPTLAEILSALGYSTHAVGKWHVGAASVRQTPTGRGFDTYMGYLQGQCDYWNKTVAGGYDFWDEKKPGTYRRPAMWAVGNYSLTQYRDRANKLITQYTSTHATASAQNANPFFLYMAYQSVHLPLEALSIKDKRCDKSKRRVYCCMTLELDDAISSLENTLRTTKMWDNTLIIATTDNGGMVPFSRTDYNTPLDPLNPYPIPFPASLGSNYPLRGSKTTLFEGGVRATAFVTGGALHPSERGTIYSELSHAVDLTAFAVRAARGWTTPSSMKEENMWEMDGSPLWGLRLQQDIGNDTPIRRGREVVPINIIHHGAEYSAVRFGRWKLIIGGDVTGADGWYPAQADHPPRRPSNSSKSRRNIWGQPILLFDLVLDPREEVDLARNFTKAVEEGMRIIKDIVALPSYREPQGGNRLHVAAMPSAINGNSWRPFLRDVVAL